MGDSLQVMGYNIRHDSLDDEESWLERKIKINRIIQQANPDLIGMQECLHHQMVDLEGMLPEYDWIGLGREGGSKGEYTPIFYKKNRFNVLAYDHFWLSDTPDVIASRTWGNLCTRIATWVHFLDKETGKSFYHMNTHFDNYSSLARSKGAELIAQKTADFEASLPVLLTGDFNVGYDSTIHHYFKQETDFVDVWDIAKKTENANYGSFNDFQDPTGGEERIDWILLKGNAEVDEVQLVMNKVDGQFPSDHFPVVTSVHFMD